MEFTQEAQPDANAVLHTSNDVRLYVIKENLSFYSPVFRKMFESAEGTYACSEDDDSYDSSCDTAFYDASCSSSTAYERNLPILKVLEPASLLERMLPYFWPHFDGQLHHEDTTFCSKNTRIEGYVAALNFLEKYEFPFKAFQKHFVTLIK